MKSILADRRVIALMVAGVYWFFSTKLDFLFFSFFNGHLLYMPWIYKYCFAIMNHPNENSCDIFLVVATVGWFFFKYSTNRKSAIWFMVLLAIWYEIGFQLAHKIEVLSCVARHSPSLEYGVFVDLREVHPLAKVYAQYSFPSGHALIFGYFGALSQVLFPKHLRKRYFILSLICCLPRLVAGAHAVSDILAGYGIGMGLWASFLGLSRLLSGISSRLQKQPQPLFQSEELSNHFTY